MATWPRGQSAACVSVCTYGRRSLRVGSDVTAAAVDVTASAADVTVAADVTARPIRSESAAEIGLCLLSVFSHT